MPVNARGTGFQLNLKLKDWPRIREQFDIRADAEAWELTCRAAHRSGKPIPRREDKSPTGRVYTIGELVHHCEKVRWNSRKSGKHLASIAQLFADWVGPKVPAHEALTVSQIETYVIYRQGGKSKSGSTINRHLSAISVLGEQAAKLKLIPAKPELPWQKEGTQRLRWFTREEESQILLTLQFWGMQQWADLFIFLVDTGARLGETEKLRWGDIRGRSITFEGVNTKNAETRTVTATARVLEVLERRKHAGGSLGPFAWVDRQELRVLWNRLRAHFDWMGEDTVVHTFRHTCASRLVQGGVDLYRVKTWMGHKDIATTQRYAHLAPRHLEELADVLAA